MYLKIHKKSLSIFDVIPFRFGFTHVSGFREINWRILANYLFMKYSFRAFLALIHSQKYCVWFVFVENYNFFKFTISINQIHTFCDTLASIDVNKLNNLLEVSRAYFSTFIFVDDRRGASSNGLSMWCQVIGLGKIIGNSNDLFSDLIRILIPASLIYGFHFQSRSIKNTSPNSTPISPNSYFMSLIIGYQISIQLAF